MKNVFAVVFLSAFCANLFGQDLLSQTKPERLLQEGVSLMMQNQFGSARQQFDALMKVPGIYDAMASDAQYYLAVCGLYLYHNNAEKLVEDFVQANPKHPKAAVAYFDLANFYYNEKNYKKADQSFKKLSWASLNATEQTTGRFRWAYSLFNLRFLKESLDQFNFVKSLGGAYGPAASYYAGFIEFNQGDYSNALIDLQRAVQQEAYAKIVPYLICNVYYKQKNYDELLRYISSIKSNDVSNQEDIALLAAEAYFKKSDFKNAYESYKSYLNDHEDPTDKGLLLRAGYSAFVQGMDDDAMKYLKNSFVDNDSVGYYSSYYLGAIYLKRNQKPMALASFDVARRYTADLKMAEESSFLFAKISYESGKSDQAIAEFEKLLVRFPGGKHETEVRELLSQAYVNANNYNKAIAYIEALPRRSAAVEIAYQKATLLKGQELFNKDDYAAAAAMFEKSLTSPVNEDLTAEASFWCGEALSVLRKFDAASSHYLRVIGGSQASDVLLLNARYGLGYAYYNSSDYERALFSFKDFVTKAARDNTNLTDAEVRLADCYFIGKQYEDALKYYRKVAAAKRTDEDYARMQTGVILGIQSKYDLAAAEFDFVIKSFPGSAYLEETRFQKAQLEFEQGKYELAVADYTAVIQTNSSSKFTPYAFSRRAASYFNLKEYGKTADDYISLLQRYPNHPITSDVLLPLQESLNLAGRVGEFAQHLAGFKTTNPDAKGIESVEFEAAKSAYFNQDYNRALTSLSSFINNYPQSARVSEAKYYQGESYYRTKDYGKALDVYVAVYADKTFAFANKVVSRLAELEYKRGSYQQAIQFFHQLRQLSASKKEQYAAWAGLMESHFLLAQYDSAAQYAAVILEKGSINAGAQNKALLFLGKCSMAKGDYENAKDEFLSTLNAAQDEYGAEAKYLLGELFFLGKDYKLCYETLVALTTDFAAYPEWVGKSFLLLSDSYLAQGDRYQAKATLKSLDNFPLQTIKDLAKARLEKLDREDLLKNAVKSDSTENEKK